MAESFDVIVLGVGGMGSAACAELAARGRRVLGLEQFPLVHARGSSHGHTRIIRTAYAEGPQYVPLARRAFEKWYDLEQRTGRHLLTECPCLNAGPSGSEHVEGVRKSVREHNLSAEELSGEELNRRYPAFRFPLDYRGVVERAAGFLYVEECVRAHIDTAVSLGADIRAEESVYEWREVGGGVEVKTGKGTYRAAKLVVTAGAWATKLLADVGVPLRVMRQVLTWFDVAGRAEFRRDRFPVFIVDAPGAPFYGLPAIDRFGLKVARHYHATELPDPDAMNWEPISSDETDLRPLLDEFLPHAGPLTKAQVCMYTVTPDLNFVIDAHPRFPNVSVACGFSGHGFKFASVVGEIMADLAERDTTAHDIGLFRADANLSRPQRLSPVMNLRLDHLLDDLRSREGEVLRAIDTDPLLLKRQSGELVLANAGPMLFTPQAAHQLYAKGIVYRRDPFRLVSLPLVKIYNLGEKDVSVADLVGIASGEGNARLRFLHKLDGTLLQRFQHAGRVYFTTRGMIEGGPCYGAQDEDAPERAKGFDFLGTARRLAAARYPALVEPRPELENVTLVFEFIHPETRVITNYGPREDLVLLARFDRADFRYRTYAEVKELAAAHALSPVEEFTPAGNTLGEQIESLLASVAGTDQEGTVITIESGHRVVYRVKVKAPDYLRVLKLVVTCTYGRVVEMIDAHPEWKGWADMEAHLRSLGREQVPEEVLGFYREHFDAFAAYLADCERLRVWASGVAAGVRHEAEAEAGVGNERLLRKCFAGRAVKLPHKALVFAAFDGRLDVAAVRHFARSPEEAREAVASVGLG